jgi:uncharacterized protein (DUF736 family)
MKRDARGIFMGRIETFALDLTIGLRPVTSNNPAAPKFDVLARNCAGRFVQIGALWEKTANNGTGSFLQGQLNDPSFQDAIAIAVFPQQDESLNVVWSRPKKQAANPFNEPASSSTDDGFEPRSDDSTGDAFAPGNDLVGA